MALKLFVTYAQADNEIVAAEFRDDGQPPTPGPGVGLLVLNGPPASGFPSTWTHKVNPGPPPALVEKTAQEQQIFKGGARRTELERKIGELDATRAAMAARGYSTTPIDQEIAACVAEHAALP